MKKVQSIQWLPLPAEHDYPAAASYLTLIYDGISVAWIMSHLQSATISLFKAKDIFRASWLSLLGVSNSHVKKDKDRVKENLPLSPLLLVRDTVNGKVIIADGYHRLCAIYSFDEDAEIPCKIV